MKILHVMKILPYPANDGFSTDIWDRIRSMKRLGYFVHILITVGKGEVSKAALEKLRATVDRVDLVERSSLLTSALSSKPTLISRNSSLSTFALDQEYDVTLAESEHLSPIFSNPKLRTRVRAIRIHNNENKYMWELAKVERRPAWKLFFAMEAIRYGFNLRHIHRQADALWYISKEELQRADDSSSDREPARFWLPPSVNLQESSLSLVRKPGQVLFVGGLKHPLNREGVRWFLKEVHPRLLSIPEYELVIAGNASGSQDAYALAAEARQQARTTVHLNVENLDPLYENCGLMINPMLRGSGVKMKTIHAIQRKVPLVTTSIGAEGSGFIDGEHVRIADTPDAFASAISELIRDSYGAALMARKAFEYLVENYDSDRNLATIINALTYAEYANGAAGREFSIAG